MLKNFVRMITVSYLLNPGIGIAETTSETIVSDGEPVQIEEANIWVTPPAGWELLRGELGKALIIQEPKAKKVVYGKETYQRNLTVAVSHQGTPIDDKSITELKSKISEAFGRYGSDFRMAEKHELIDYKKKGDGVLFYSFLTINKIEMTQAHVFVSGAKQSLLMTYTDLSERFDKDQETFASIWTTMITPSIDGLAPGRFDEYKVPGAVGGLLALLFIAFVVIRRVMAGRAYNEDTDFASEDEVDFVSSDEPVVDGPLEANSGFFSATTSW